MPTQDRRTNKVLASWSRHGGLYALDEPETIEAYFSNRFQVTSDDTWCKCVGHQQARVLQYLRSNNLIRSNKRFLETCNSCQMSNSKLSFFRVELRRKSRSTEEEVRHPF
eukprot:TRINITY_DN3883_c0_g2_i1.p2 TRINITY_DN3883_c0_g2~~TRINITY_DN3883_c0_g2_i1.p2  ORF type:complete len:110 (-),score=8.18 TRINITY_DN3883_c0_g2_i1:68-397(-)